MSDADLPEIGEFVIPGQDPAPAPTPEPEIPEPDPENPPDAPDRFTFPVNYKGAKIEITDEEELRNLAQKGLDYEVEMRRLRDERRDYEGYVAMKQLLDNDPKRREQINAILAGGEAPQKEERAADPWKDLELSLANEQDETKKTETEDVVRLRKQVEELQGKIRDREDAEERDRMENLLRTEVGKYEELVSAGELAYAPILSLLQLRPDADPKKVVEVVARQFADYRRKIAGSFVKRKEETPPGGGDLPNGQPPKSAPKRLNRSDLEDGSVRRMALEFWENQESSQ